MRRDARTGAGAARRCVRRRDKRISAVVNVQKSSLRAFKQNVRVPAHRVVQENNGVRHKRFQEFSGGYCIPQKSS